MFSAPTRRIMTPANVAQPERTFIAVPSLGFHPPSGGDRRSAIDRDDDDRGPRDRSTRLRVSERRARRRPGEILVPFVRASCRAATTERGYRPVMHRSRLCGFVLY